MKYAVSVIAMLFVLMDANAWANAVVCARGVHLQDVQELCIAHWAAPG